ncbi:MAG: sugar ABC transporter permease [Spirochaetales bacterium]|jgi:arabinogalactan oligomer/maltooligosaccharide transport system permease protein|nr:sugar ABC transporter permease [Sphaerochaetaceae bacterium]NLV84524.1 sugar ABC transporter permease [Spirochaetales bacterium]
MSTTTLRSRRISNGIIYTILSVMSVIWLIPIVWLVIRSFQKEKGAWITTVLPQGYTFDNYIRLFTETDQFNYPLWFVNTLVVAIFTCIFATMLVLMISYTFSRLRFKSRKMFMNIGLILNMFPGFMTMIAVYHILKAIGLYQSHISLVLVYSSGASLSYFIAKGFFDTIPKAMDEAATIDGATRNQIFWRITLPLTKPIVIYTALTSFLAPWMDFIFASVIMKDNYNKYTLAVGLFRMLERENIYEYFTRFCAGAVIVSIPITILFIFFQKYYVEGVTGGSTKG